MRDIGEDCAAGSRLDPVIEVSRKRDLLTARERDCLLLSGRGYSEKEVAIALEISPNTVRVHIENIKRKLGAANKSHAIVLAMLCGEASLRDFSDDTAKFA